MALIENVASKVFTRPLSWAGGSIFGGKGGPRMQEIQLKGWTFDNRGPTKLFIKLINGVSITSGS